MFGFFRKKNSFLGIDISNTGIKIVEIKKGDRQPELTNYSIVSAENYIGSGRNKFAPSIEEMIESAIKAGSFSAKDAILGIPGYLSLIFFLDLPEMPEQEIEGAVRFEAAKYIPTPIEEVNFGWEIVGSYQGRPVEGGQQQAIKKNQIMVVTVPKKTVEDYSKVVSTSKIRINAIEVENFAAIRAMVGNDKGTFMVVDIGAKSTDLTVVSDGLLKVTRSIDVGGTAITRAIASGLGIDYERADSMKTSGLIDFGKPNDELTQCARPIVDLISDEIKRLHVAYHKKNPVRKIEKIIFSGGTSKIKGLMKYFGTSSGIECVVGNPLARVSFDEKYRPLLNEIALELTIAIGLALRGVYNKS